MSLNNLNLNKESILHGNRFKFSSKDSFSYLLQQSKFNCNAFVYYDLLLYLPDYEFPFYIGSFHIIFRGQKLYENASNHIQDSISFIMGIESAEKLLCFLSPNERRLLEIILDIKYDSSGFQSEEVFQRSILHIKTLTEFINIQRQIREYMKCPIDFKKIILENTSQIDKIILNFYELNISKYNK